VKLLFTYILLLLIILIPKNEVQDCELKFNPIGINSYIDSVAVDYGLDSELINTIIMIESHWDTSAISHDKMDYGLMQVRITTAKGYFPSISKEELLNPYINVMIGAMHLQWLGTVFNKKSYMIVAYNVGHGAALKIKHPKQMSYYVKYNKAKES